MSDLRQIAYETIVRDEECDPEFLSEVCKVLVLAQRRPKLNQWDDTLTIITPEAEFSFPGNTQPTRYGWNPTAGKQMAELVESVIPLRTGHHNGKDGRARQMTPKEALQAELERFFKDHRAQGKVTVRRVDKSGRVVKVESGLYHTNLHPGGRTTSSAGCITVEPSIADEFFHVLYRELGKHGQVWPHGWFPVVLTTTGT